MTKAEFYKQQAAARRDALNIEKAKIAAMIPNPDYRRRLTYSEIFKGMKKQPKFISPPAAMPVDLFGVALA
jgi:hypothetical protein